VQGTCTVLISIHNSLTIFGLVLPPFCLRSADINFSRIINLNLNFGLIRKFAIQIIGLSPSNEAQHCVCLKNLAKAVVILLHILM